MRTREKERESDLFSLVRRIFFSLVENIEQKENVQCEKWSHALLTPGPIRTSRSVVLLTNQLNMKVFKHAYAVSVIPRTSSSLSFSRLPSHQLAEFLSSTCVKWNIALRIGSLAQQRQQPTLGHTTLPPHMFLQTASHSVEQRVCLFSDSFLPLKTTSDNDLSSITCNSSVWRRRLRACAGNCNCTKGQRAFWQCACAGNRVERFAHVHEKKNSFDDDDHHQPRLDTLHTMDQLDCSFFHPCLIIHDQQQLRRKKKEEVALFLLQQGGSHSLIPSSSHLHWLRNVPLSSIIAWSDCWCSYLLLYNSAVWSQKRKRKKRVSSVIDLKEKEEIQLNVIMTIELSVSVAWTDLCHDGEWCLKNSLNCFRCVFHLMIRIGVFTLLRLNIQWRIVSWLKLLYHIDLNEDEESEETREDEEKRTKSVLSRGNVFGGLQITTRLSDWVIVVVSRLSRSR